MNAFSTSLFISSAMNGKIKQYVCIKLYVKLNNSTTEMLREVFGELYLSGRGFLNGIRISRPVECQLKMTNVQDDQAPGEQ